MKLLRSIAVLFLTSMLALAGWSEEGTHIVFIHGLGDNPTQCWSAMVGEMVTAGFVKRENCLLIDYSEQTHQYPHWNNTPIEDVAVDVALEVFKFWTEHGRPQLNFVVHSMGGLVLRSMVSQKMFSEMFIGRVVTLATPHYGQDCWSIAKQVDEMDYGSEFMWNLANAEVRISSSKVLSIVGNGDRVVDYYAAALNGSPVVYVAKSHCNTYTENDPAITQCSDGRNDIVLKNIYNFFGSGVTGPSLAPVRNDVGAMLLQVVDGKGKPVEYKNPTIVKEVHGDVHLNVDFENNSPDKAYAKGIVAPAQKVGWTPLRSGGGLPVDSYKFVFNESKDKKFEEFTTDGTYDIVNGRTTVAQIPAENTKPVDFVFLIDSTGSMGGSINSVKNNAKRLIQEKLGNGSRNCRVAVADYRDFPVSPYGDSGDYTFKLRCGFTTDATAAINSLSGITANGGNDTPEAVYSAIASCVQGYGAALGGWRKEAVKTIMLMCDAGPHDPEPFTNYTQAKIIKMLNTLEDEEDEEEASVVDEGEHRLYSLKAMSFAAAKAGESGSVGGVSLYPVLTTSSSSLSSTFAPLATETGGKVVNSGNYDSVASAVEKVIEQSIAANGFEYETVSVKENAGSVTIRVYGGNSSMPASVGYQVVSGTAVGGTDYTADGEVHRLSWAEGERSYKTITIPIIADASSTADKFFSVILCDGENMGLGGTSICRIDVLDASSTGSGIPAGKVFIQGMARQPALGGVSGAGLYDVESVATLIATPTEGNVFTSWENGSTTATRTINTSEAWSNAVNGVATYVASFKPISEVEEPSIAAVKAVSLCVGEEFFWQLDYDSETAVEVVCEGLPLGLTFKDGCVSGTPEKAGKYPVEFVVRNAKDEVRTTVVFSVLRTALANKGCVGENDGSFSNVFATAATYDGYVLDAAGAFVGTIQVKTTKGAANKKTGVLTSTVTATLTLNGKKWSYSKGTTGADGLVSGLACTTKGAPADALVIELGENGFSGELGTYAIFGARNGMVVKNDPMVSALDDYKNNWSMTLAYGVESYSRWRLSVGAKGVIKVSGVLADGTAVTANSQLIMGDGFAYVPVVVAKTAKRDAINLLVRIDSDGVVSVASSDFGAPVDAGATEPIELEGLADSANAMVGVCYEGRVAINELGYPAKFSASGLPTGLKINASTGVISGVPTKAGTYDKVKVTIVSGSNSKDKKIATYAIDISPMPQWAQGTFTGSLGEGTFTMTVTAAGKISGKAATLGTNFTFSATGYAASSESDLGLLTVTADLKSGKAVFPMTLTSKTWMSEIGTRFVDNASFAGETFLGEISAWRTLWSDKENAKNLSGWAGAYTYVTADGEVLTINLDEKGVAKITGTLKDKRKVSTSSTLFVTEEDKRDIILYVVPDNKKGLSALFKEISLKNWYHAFSVGGKIAYRNAAVTAAVSDLGSGGGTVAVSPKYGQAEVGKQIALTAKPDKNSVFVKWVYTDPELGSMESFGSTLKMPSVDSDLVVSAVFRSKSEPVAQPIISYNSLEFSGLRVGVCFESQLMVPDDARPVKFTAKNLPTGLKLEADTGRIYGVPTKVMSGTIVVTATSTIEKKKTDSRDVSVSVAELPDNFIGTFYGYIDDNSAKTGNPWWGLTRGTFTLTATAQGKLTLKVVSGYGTASYTTTGWTGYSNPSYGGIASVDFVGKNGEVIILDVRGDLQWSDCALEGEAVGGIFGIEPLQFVGQMDAFRTTGSGKNKVYEHPELSYFKSDLVGTWKFMAEERSGAGVPDYEGKIYPYTHDFTLDQTATKPAISLTIKEDGMVKFAGTFQGEKISGTQKALVWWWNGYDDCCHVYFHQKLKNGKECHLDFDLRTGHGVGSASLSGSGWIQQF